MKKINSWFVVSEAQGLVKSGGLADVGKALPKAIQEIGHQIAIAIPGYSTLPGIDNAELLLTSKLDYWPHTPYKVKKLDLDGVPVYAIDCPQYFHRAELYAENNQAYADNGERFAFFSSAVIDCLPKLNVKPDIIHVNDWHTGLVPLLLKTRYINDERFKQIRCVLTVHNANFQGVYSYDELASIPELNAMYLERIKYSQTHVGMLRAGLAYADKINAVSPNYASELLTPLGSHGLFDDFSRRRHDLTGILNGCDYSEWDPEQDSFIPVNYTDTPSSLKQGKAASKAILQKEHNLAQREVVLFGMVCRLTHQKGFDYILPILEQFLCNDVQLIMMGTGDPNIAEKLRIISAKNSDKFVFIQSYNDRLAHLVEAGADFFLMPSEFEACGLNQIYSMAYGTLPIVREVGGLKDTVIDYDKDPEHATGFVFQQPDSNALLATMQRALIFYLQCPQEMVRLQLNAMKRDFNWRDSAKSYVDMYRSAMSE